MRALIIIRDRSALHEMPLTAFRAIRLEDFLAMT